MKKSTYIRRKIIAAVICVILAGVIGFLIGRGCAEEPAWDVCYEMANKNIEWTYAGR
jgi:hypothetical protein